jgi:hypothetical protein
MIRYFPMPFTDESIYSIFRRYDKLTGNNNYYVTAKELMGNRNFNVDYSFAKGLDFLCDKLPESTMYTLEFFINNHTLLPIYKTFIPENRYTKAVECFKSGMRTSVSSAIGNHGGRICKIEGFKYCPKCIEHDRNECGEAYIHRLHQIEGNFLCIKHNCFLQEYRSQENDKCIFNDIEKIHLNAISDKRLGELSKELYNLTSDIEFLLFNFEFFPNYQLTKEKYYSKLTERGYFLANGQIDQVKLHNEFLKYYSAEFLDKIESNVDINQESNWLRNITKRKNRTIKPIRNLILIRFLFGELKEFIEYKNNKMYNPMNSKDISVKKVKRYTNERYESRRESYRKLFSEVIEKEPKIIRIELRRRYPEAYRYLQNCDNVWFENTLQSSSIPRYSYKNNCVDWEKRDSETYKRVREAINSIINNEKPYRITLKLISDTVNYGHLSTQLFKLPKTKKLIDDSIEELMDFHKRKMKIAFKQLHKEKSKITPSTILRKANINDKHRYNYDEFLGELLSENIKHK